MFLIWITSKGRHLSPSCMFLPSSIQLWANRSDFVCKMFLELLSGHLWFFIFCLHMTSFKDINSLLFLQEFTMHDTIGCYIDADKSQISFSKNGKWPVFFSTKQLINCIVEINISTQSFYSRKRSWTCIWNSTAPKKPGPVSSLCPKGNLFLLHKG